jgi:hypothetical protein
VVRIFSIDGRPVLGTRIVQHTGVLDLSGIPAGLYILKIENSRNTTFKRIVVK